MDISVVVVTLGRTALIEHCVRAIGTGTLRPRQLVVVDQGEPGLEARLHEWLDGSRVQLEHVALPPTGVSRARNAGARSAAGDHLAFIDDDCVPEPDWLAALVEAIEATPADVASGRVLPLEDGRPGRIAVSQRADTRAHVFRGMRDSVPWDVGTGGNLLVSRRAFERAGWFDEEFGPGARFRAAEDVELLERLLCAGATVSYTPRAVVRHERKTRADYLRRRVPYGFGMGALAARADLGRRALLVRRYLTMQGRAAVAGLRAASLRRAIQPLLSIAGFVAGFVAARGRSR
jgi:O-antigen biosynthesis protein